MADWTPGRILLADLRKGLLAAAAFSVLIAPGAPASAQNYNRPPADVGDSGYGGAGGDTSSILRIDRLENQVRSLNGQVEQLQFQVRRMEDQMRKFQLDVEARFQEGAAKIARPAAVAPQKRSELPEGDVPGAGAPPSAQATYAPPVSADGRRHDAYDPDNQPSAPGAPLPLGSPASASGGRASARTAESRRDPSGPLDLSPPGLREPAASPPAAGATIASIDTGAPAAVAAAPADPVKVEYDAATDLLKTQHYDAAQQGFSAFVQKNPHSRLIAPAIYHLGESFYYQSRHREAAEQFLKIATDYSKSPVAPDAMVKLGVSLNALGAKEQACAFFSELPRKYPNASPAEKTAAAREARKASC
jgi:tol-pal system protein YbgF